MSSPTTTTTTPANNHNVEAAAARDSNVTPSVTSTVVVDEDRSETVTSERSGKTLLSHVLSCCLLQSSDEMESYAGDHDPANSRNKAPVKSQTMASRIGAKGRGGAGVRSLGKLEDRMSVTTVTQQTSDYSLLLSNVSSMAFFPSWKSPTAAKPEQAPESSKSNSNDSATMPYSLTKHENAEELGYMRFHCTCLNEARELAQQWQRPVLAVQIQIPGDLDAGTEIFSHPLIVEAAESHFVSVLEILNNKKLVTTTTIAPVQPSSSSRSKRRPPPQQLVERDPSGKLCRTKVLFQSPDGETLAPTLSGDSLSLANVSASIVEVLQNYSPANSTDSTKGSPKYLSLLCDQEQGRKVHHPINLYLNNHHHSYDYNTLHTSSSTTSQTTNTSSASASKTDPTAYFVMPDSVQGEVEFASVEGVFEVHAVFFDSQRAVEVHYDADKCQYSLLVRHALQHGLAPQSVLYRTNDERCAASVELAKAHISNEQTKVELLDEGQLRRDPDSKHYLRQTPLRFVPLADIQAAQANRLISLGRFNEATHLLSPWQGTILMHAMRSRSFFDVADVPILPAWISVSEQTFPVVPERGCHHTTTADSLLLQQQQHYGYEQDDENKIDEDDDSTTGSSLSDL